MGFIQVRLLGWRDYFGLFYAFYVYSYKKEVETSLSLTRIHFRSIEKKKDGSITTTNQLPRATRRLKSEGVSSLLRVLKC